MQSQVAIGFAKSETALRDQVDQGLGGRSGLYRPLEASYGFPDQSPIALLEAIAGSVVKVASGDDAAGQEPRRADKEAPPPAQTAAAGRN